MSRPALQASIVPIAAAIAFVMLTWPVWQWLWGEWMGNDYYSHGVLIAPVALFLVVQRIRNDDRAQWRSSSGSSYGLLMLVPSLLLYLFFLENKALYLAAFAMIGMVAGLVWTLGGGAMLAKLAFPIGYLALMVPLPFIERATLPLAMFTGVCSGGLVQLFGLDVTIVGNAVTLPNADLVIGAQCSGINSLIALTSLTVLAAYLLDGPLWGKLILVVLSVPLAIVGNILRVASLLVVARFYGADAAFTFYHDYSGAIFFLVALVLLFPLTRLLQCRTLRLEVI